MNNNISCVKSDGLFSFRKEGKKEEKREISEYYSNLDFSTDEIV
jgi:hypothetical protein